jgi:pentalenene oxygenase
LPRSPLTARAFFRDPLGYVEARGPSGVVHLAAGRSRYVLVRDPDAIWRVLVSDGGAYAPGKWKRRARRFLGDTLNTLSGPEHRQRRMALQPALARPRVSAAAPRLLARAERMAAGWQDGAEVGVRAELDPLALAMAGDLLLSTDLAPEARELAGQLRTIMAGVPRLTPPLLATRHGRALAQVERRVEALLEDRRRAGANGGADGRASANGGDRRAGASGGDLLDVLLTAGLPRRTARGEVIAFLLAAVDEPPAALEAAFYLLGLHPEAEARLHSELDAVVGDREPLADDLPKLTYLDAVLREALRLFPPARHIDRCPVRDVTIGGEHVRAGTNVVVSPFVTHREPGLHDRAASFFPERWLEEASRRRSRGTYVPFGAGVHTCVGEPLARAVMTATLASVARRWRLRVAPDAPAPVPSAPPLVVRLERR